MEADSRTFTPEALLAETDWMRRLARALVRDVDAADDLVQDTVLAALRAQPELDRGLRPWLARVLRNFARERVRSGARRTAREAVHSAPDAELPEASELAARVELQQLVVRLVLELDEPLRRTVLLRYFEGLEPAQIAASTGAPDGTVRWRLKRALDDVRERLDERHGGNRDAWTSALLPFAIERTLVAPASASASGGALVMGTTTKWWWMSAATVIALLGWWSARSAAPASDVQGSTPETIALSQPPETELAPSQAVGEREPVASSAPSTAAAPALTRARIRFVDANGAALAGVRFTGQVGGFREQSTSGADGVAEISSALITQHVQVDFSALGPRYAQWHARETVEPGVLTELGDVQLSEGAAVTVRVLGRDGTELEDVPVCIASAQDSRNEANRAQYGPMGRSGWNEARTGEDGRARFEGLALERSIAWARVEEQNWYWSEPIELRGGEDAGVVVVRVAPRAPSARLRVIVRAHDGGEIRELWTFWRQRDDKGWSSEGGGSGKAIERTLLNATHVDEFLVYDARGTYGIARLADLDATEEPHEIVLGPGTRVPLEVVDAEGAAIRGASCIAFDRALSRAIGFRQPWSPTENALTVLDGPFDVDVRASGFAPERVGPFVAATAPRPIRIVLRARPGVRGRLLGAQGPVAGEWVSLQRVLEQPMSRNGVPCFLSDSASSTAKTDADGRFRLDVPERGRFVIACVPEGRAAAYSPEIELDPDVESGEIELTPRDGGRVEGRVRDESGRAVAGAIVGLTRGLLDGRTARADSDGNYHFDSVGAGEWFVYRAPQMLDPSSSSSGGLDVDDDWRHPFNCRVKDGETTRFELVLPSERSSEVRCTLRVDGASASGWSALLERLQHADPFAPQESSRAELDERGEARLRARHAGRWRVTFMRALENGAALNVQRELDLTGEAVDLVCELRTGALDVEHSAAPKTGLHFAWRGSEGWRAHGWFKTDAAGRAHLAPVPAGTLRIVKPARSGRWSEAWDWPLVATVEIEAGRSGTCVVR